MGYDDKDRQLQSAKRRVSVEFVDLHPTDRVEAFGQLSEWAAEHRDARARINECEGVPDRPEDTIIGEIQDMQP